MSPLSVGIYNNADSLGFVEALEKQRQFFREIQNLDMLKDAFTLPGLALSFPFNLTEKNSNSFQIQNLIG